MIEGRLSTVFATMATHEVRCLLMGGQACVLYGAAEFSKDIDFAILSAGDNLDKVGAAMRSLDAKVVAVPPFRREFLDEGLAVHFRCGALGVEGLRVDLMSRMRGVDPFAELWARRYTLEFGGVELHVMNVRDLVAAKKTQRDKDWPMIQRLMEVRYLKGGAEPPPEELVFWLRELRTAELIIDVAERFPDETAAQLGERRLLRLAIDRDRDALERALVDEMLEEKERDRRYWEPLKRRLADLRRRERDA